MGKKIIIYQPLGYEFSAAVIVDKIVRLSKKNDEGDITIIHLDNGEELETETSINTLAARINSED